MDTQQPPNSGRTRRWLGLRAPVLIAAVASVLTLGLFTAVTVAIFSDGDTSSSEPSSSRVAQGHDEAGRSPLQSAEDAVGEPPNARIAAAHTMAMESPWRKIATDITIAIAPSYRPARRDEGLSVAKTTLMEFESAPFPYDGPVTSARPTAYADDQSDDARMSGNGKLFRQKQAYNDRRVLLHIPPTFDARRPGAIVVFFHGHRATLTRDVLNRQQVAAQISASGANAVLVAPQFAVAASDSSPGNLGEPGGFKRFLDEASQQIAAVHGNPALARAFAAMPVVMVAYSGGYLAAAWSLHHGGATNRVRGVVLLDALYSDVDKFAAWIAGNRDGFFLSAYMGRTTRLKNTELMQTLNEQEIPYVTEMPPRHRRDNVVFLATVAGTTRHNDFVTHAWAVNPIADVLQRQASRLVGGGAVARSPASGAVR